MRSRARRRQEDHVDPRRHRADRHGAGAGGSPHRDRRHLCRGPRHQHRLPGKCARENICHVVVSLSTRISWCMQATAQKDTWSFFALAHVLGHLCRYQLKSLRSAEIYRRLRCFTAATAAPSHRRRRRRRRSHSSREPSVCRA